MGVYLVACLRYAVILGENHKLLYIPHPNCV